jgi:hypothetical protein
MDNRVTLKRDSWLWLVIAVLANASLLSGCIIAEKPAVFGLVPLYPEVRVSHLAATSGASLDFVEVNSLRPQLRWEPFPRELYVDLSDVTYELMIWESEKGLPGALVYSRQALQEPSHKLEVALEPFRDYLWTLRARFHLNGHPRVTEWGMSQVPSNYRIGDPLKLLKLPVTKNPNFYRFRTPARERFDPSPGLGGNQADILSCERRLSEIQNCSYLP